MFVFNDNRAAAGDSSPFFRLVVWGIMIPTEDDTPEEDGRSVFVFCLQWCWLCGSEQHFVECSVWYSLSDRRILAAAAAADNFWKHPTTTIVSPLFLRWLRSCRFSLSISSGSSLRKPPRWQVERLQGSGSLDYIKERRPLLMIYKIQQTDSIFPSMQYIRELTVVTISSDVWRAASV